MLALIKIRTKYLSQHACGVYWGYLFIPSMIILSLINLGSFQRRELEDGNIIKGYKLNQNRNLFNQSYSKISSDKFAILVDEENDCNIFRNQDYFNVTLECGKEENKLDNQKNIIKIINKNGKYDIKLHQTEKNYVMDKRILDTSTYSDLFYDVHEPSSYYYDYTKFNSYYDYYLEIQSLISKFLIIKNGKGSEINKKQLTMELGKNSYPPNTDWYTDYIGIVTGITIAFTLQFSMTTYFFNIRMIDEKEKKLTLLLERQGLLKKQYFISWLLSYLILSIIPIIAFFLFYALFVPLHMLLFFINIILFIFSLFSFAYFFYVCISTTKTASVVIKFFNFTASVLGVAISFPECSKITKIILAFIPQINIYLCSISIDKLQKFKELSWEKLWLKANRVSYMECIILYIAEIILYSLLSIFIEKYNNSGLNFFQFIKSFFTHVSREINIKKIEDNNNIGNNILHFEKYFQELSPINQQRKANNDCLSIINVSKNFDKLKAVDNFNCDLFGNEIFCLLGHNGAGKTTLVNMISGIFDPSQGDIFYNGRSIVTDKNYLFENIGVCQQEDIFFEYLTVSEHLEYMCQIKGGEINLSEIRDLILKIGLAEKSVSLCSTLSGGQKRKLCTALALIGNSRIILLDEPSSGMDPISKKGLWEFLKNYQKNKIILITTHSLDEAEYLGDRIGIMSDGQFICCGTSSFLKSKYPCGFNINLLINSSVFNEDKKNIVFERIKSYEPKAEIKIASKSVFSINIQSNNEHIPEIFKFIEESKADYGIEDYTVASTSLEDVFLKINNKSDLNDMKYTNKQVNNQELIVPENLVNISGFCTQLISQLSRNALPLYRNKVSTLLEYFSGLGIIYIFVFLFRDLIYGITNPKLDLIEILESNRNYIYEVNEAKGVLKNSYVYDSSSFITLKTLSRKPNDLEDLINLSYKEAFSHIAIGSISINKIGDNWNAYISCLNLGYYFADTMFVVSAFLKKEFGIDTKILSEIELKTEMSIGKNQQIDGNTLGVLIIVCVSSVFGFVIFLGGLINEKIKERKTNIKHLLYLSGSNSWSYWLSFFIIDYIKLILFTILLIIPIFYVNETGGYYFLLNMVVIDISSLIFIYFISFFGSNADSGVKFLFTILLGFVIFLIGFTIFSVFLLIVNIRLIIYVYESFANSYNFTLFDLTPVTSMLLSFGRILYGIANYEFDPTHQYGPATYLYTSFIAQGINIVFYTTFLILMETGYLKQFLNYIKIQLCISEHNFVFSQEQMSDEFLIYNNVNNPIIENQIDNQQNQNNINNTNNQNNNMNMPIYGNNNQNNINMPIYGNNNQFNMNTPIYGNNNQVDMNAPIFGNNNQVDMNAPIFGNNNQIDMNDQIPNDNNLVINNSLNSNISQPLLQGLNYDNTNNINTNMNNNINNNMNNGSNSNLNIDAIDNAIYDLSLPENNSIYNVRKGNPYVNKEKDNLMVRNDLTTRIEGLRKTFWFCCKKSVRAVNNLYLGLEANEKFGLLGFNGSGKTTTFRAITNEILYDYGKITLFGCDNRKEFEKIRSKIGYCPQANPLFEFMKVREILDFYSNLKTCFIPYQVICEKFGLTKYLETYCINLSGGNKRKLTFAIAIMNKPTLLLLDEPSTGVDPDSRRFMWKNINELSNSGHKYNMILTTHSMEEAEILCDRVSWLKRGNFVCIGNPEKLKLQYSLGYKLHVKFDDRVINQSGLNQNNMGEAFRIICGLIFGFANYSRYIMNNPGLEPYIRALIEVIRRINTNTKRITLVEIGKDLSFELILNINQNKKQTLFTEVLNMKNTDNKISEMIISMESLENILTSLR